jgi:hypothetical protein
MAAGEDQPQAVVRDHGWLVHFVFLDRGRLERPQLLKLLGAAPLPPQPVDRLVPPVVVIQAPGFSGMPRSGHTCIATTNASWTASSARSKSPRTRISEASARPDSWRKTRSTSSGDASGSFRRRFLDEIPAFVEDHHRPDLDRADLGAGNLGWPTLDRLVQVLAVEDVESRPAAPSSRRRARR